ncbi:MAG: Ig-like domain-containing protein [Thermoplasmata archaeon]|nr:MAG: Ig-like domain-containing protein [Thermoplasmata archaeon]
MDNVSKNRKRLYSGILAIVILLLMGMMLLPGASAQPRVIDTDPNINASDVPVDTWIIIRFNQSIVADDVEVEIRPDLDPYGFRIEWSNNDRELIIKPNAALVYGRNYTITLRNAKNADGEALENPIIRFKTESEPGIFENFGQVFESIWDGFIAIIPKLIMTIALLIVGYIIAKAASWVFRKTLKKVGFDDAMEKVGVGAQLRTIGIESVSKFLGIFVFWFIFVIVLQIAIAGLGVPSVTDILAPIILFIPRILVAAIVVLVGLYIANVVANRLMEKFQETSVGKQLADIDEKTKKAGISMIQVVSMFIKIFILLFFVQVALEIVNIGVLAEIITPIMIILPLVLVALFIVLVGILVAEFIIKTIMKLAKEFDIDDLIKPVEETIGREGVIMRIFTFVVRIFVLLIFIQIAIGVLNATGAFNALAELINTAILWIPNVVAALFIVLIGFWFGGWVYERMLTSGKEIEVPYPETLAVAVKYLIIYVACVIAIAQIGIAVDILYIITAIVLGAVFIGIGAGFAIGSKDIFANVGGHLQSKKVLTVGKRVKIDDKYVGKVEEVGRFTTTIIADNGDKIVLPNSKLTKAVIVESPS